MGKYEEYVSKFLEDYEQPVAEEYIVGFSGIDPDRKVKPETISHEKLDGLLGGDFAGRYHVTREQLREFISYQSQIDSLESETRDGIAEARREASAGLRELGDSTQEKIDSLRASTNAGLSKISAECEAEISRLDTRTVQQISEHKSDTQETLREIRSEVRTTAGELAGRMSEIASRQSEISGRQELMMSQYEAAISGLTEDSEVIDARVGNDGRIYGTLGGRLRELESSGESGLKELHETDARLWDAIREESQTTGELALGAIFGLRNEEGVRKSGDEELRRDISTSRVEADSIRENLQGQADELAWLSVKHEIDIKELVDEQEAEAKALEREAEIRGAHDQALLDGLSLEEEARKVLDGEIRQEISDAIVRYESLQEQIARTTEELRQDISATNLRRREIYEQLREESDELSGEIQRQALQRESDQKEQATRLEHEEESRQRRESYEQEQLTDLAGAIILGQVNQKADRAKAEQGLETLKSHISHWESRSQEADARLKDELTSLSSGLIDTVEVLREEARKRRQKTAELAILREDMNETAYTAMSLAVQLGRKIIGKAENSNPLDWSKSESLAIPEPRCAIVNFTGLSTMPTTKTAEIPAFMEFWDKQGNYFRKPIVCSAQGNSSLGYVKKNVKFDLLNADGTEFELKIGDWVVQDGYHLKAYYTDFFRGVAVTSYKFCDDIMRFNGIDKDRPYKRAMIDASEIQPSGTSLNNADDMTLQLDNGALCHPDGFPCLVYLNGEFYGIYSWQIKKQRKNYRMDKSKVEHIHLDGSLNTGNFWNGVINWTAFEIRNPNKLYTMDGKKYDGDAPRELIDETSEKYNPDNKDHMRSARVKRYIQSFVERFGELKQLYTAYRTNPSDETLAAAKAAYEALFDWENQRDYLIFSDIIKNSDGFGKNWQWTTYDGERWYVNAYDLDMSYGGHWQGIQITPPLTGHITTSTAIPTGYIPLLYKDELEERYRALRNAGIISVSNILSKLYEWTARIGVSNYELEYERWPNSPCIQNYTDSIYRVKRWLESEIANMDKVYKYESDTEKLDRIQEDIFQSSTKGEQELSQTRKTLQAGISELQEQINELAYMKLSDLHEQRDQRERLAMMESDIDAILSEIDPDYVPAEDGEIDDMIDRVLSGETVTGDGEYDDPEFDAMIDEIFGVNP